MANIIEITDFHAPELDIYARYTEGQLLNRHEPEKGIFIAESPLVIGRALDGGCQPISILWRIARQNTRRRRSSGGVIRYAKMSRSLPHHLRC